MKYCGKCKEYLPEEAFAKNAAKKDGLQERCRLCRAKHYKDTGYVKVAKESRLNKKYGITSEDYDEMFFNQEGKCFICGAADETLVVDHCHSTGIVRGLLCNNCNRALGLLKDNITTLQNAIDYLENNSEDE